MNTHALTAKVGPLPAWAWGVGLGLGITGYRIWRQHQQPSAAAQTDGTPQPAPLGTSDVGGPLQPGTAGAYSIPGTYQANPGGVIGADGSTTTGTGTKATSNADWQRRAFDRLAAEGYAPTAALDALTKYLTGQPLTAQEEAMVSLALRVEGSPPEGAPTITRAAAQGTGNPPPNPNGGGTIPDVRKPFEDVFGYDPRRPGTRQPIAAGAGKMDPPPYPGNADPLY